MRQVVLDTETTGLEISQGHRIIEIGCVELLDRKLSGRHFHSYLNPDREVDIGAIEVHGINNEFLIDKPRFEQVVEDFIAFVQGAELIIHNAAFDIGFIDHELARIGGKWGQIGDYCGVVDSLALARSRHPGQKNNLDALCKRYAVDNSQRELHGALLDAEILADVYLRMTGGQTDLALGAGQFVHAGETTDQGLSVQRLPADRATLPVITASEIELAAHQVSLDAITDASGGNCLWRQLETEPTS